MPLVREPLGDKSHPASNANALSRFLQTPKTPSLRPMEHRDISAVHKLLTEYLKQFHLTPVMSREEVEHWFLPQENIIDTFVVEVRGQEEHGRVFSWASASTGRACGELWEQWGRLLPWAERCSSRVGGLICWRMHLHPGLLRVSSREAHASLRLAQPLQGSSQALSWL